jgi:hypothetical protein
VKHIIITAGITIALLAGSGQGVVSGPYVADPNTLHLYHFDGDAEDAVSGGSVNLILAYGATVTESSYADPNFGSALNTYEGTSNTGNMPIAYTDESPISSFVGPDGAFTFEAIVRPAVAINAIPNNMQIISGEDDGSETSQTFTAELPTTGDQAWAAGQWFHVAVTYNGSEGTAENLKLYWTALNSGQAEAVLLGAFQMGNDLNPSEAIDFAVGNDGRDTNGSSENFEGLVDEVRISSIARTADDMLFVPGPPPPVIITPPSDTMVHESQTASFQAVFESQSAPVAMWLKTDPSGDLELNPADPDITTQVTYDPGSGRYTSSLWIANTLIADSGAYYCRINNDSGFPRNSAAADLTILGLVARWTMDQEDYSGGLLLDVIGGHDAAPAGTPVFVDGADGTAGGAVQITADTGWADVNEFDPTLGSGVMTISVWANWQEETVPSQDLQMMAYPDANSLTAPNDLKADTQWQHFCIVCNSTVAKIYINGVLSVEGPWTLPADTTAVLNIGSASGGGESFNGYLDDLRIYNYAMSDTDVADFYYQVSGQGVCLPAYTSAYDLAGPEGQPDCFVDLYDLVVFTGQWLVLYDFEEFADFSGSWQSSSLYPN